LATIGFTPNLALLARRINEELPKFTIAQLVECYRRMGARREGARKIGLLGLAFKGVPPTGDLRGTMARPIIHELRSQFPGAAIVGFDPVVAHRNVVELGIDPVSTLDQAFAGAALVIIQNNHPIFRDMPIEKLATTMERPGIIYDFWDQHGGKLLNLPLRIAYGGLGNLASILEMDLAKTAPQRSAKVA
jgi:UDP-N-acetyl-D-mannosaminuronate dehydrogenase